MHCFQMQLVQHLEGVTTNTSSEFVYEFNGNKGQFVRIRDKKRKFCFVLLSQVCDIFVNRVSLVSILKFT